MRIEVAVMMHVHVPDNTDLESLSLQLDQSGIRFVSNGEIVADARQVEDYYIDDIESADEDKDGEEEGEDFDEEDE